MKRQNSQQHQNQRNLDRVCGVGNPNLQYNVGKGEIISGGVTDHLPRSFPADECLWKEIMMKPENRNKYECKSCKGKNKKCSAYYVRD